MTKEALKLALEALELHGKQYPHMVKGYCLDAITSIKEALAQPEQEYHAVNAVHKGQQCYVKTQTEQPNVRTGNCLRVGVCASEGHKITPQRKPLTDEDLRKLADKHLFYQPEGYEVSGVFALARAIEAAHGIKGEA